MTLKMVLATAAAVTLALGIEAAHAERDHLMGYKIKDLDKFKAGGTFTLDDNGTLLTCEPKKAGFYLSPSEKDAGDDPRGPAAAGFVCYKAKCTGTLPPDVTANDQLTIHTLELKKATLVCMPSTPGTIVGGASYFLTDLGVNCNDTCAAAGLTYDAAGTGYALSGAANCDEVLDALGAGGTPALDAACLQPTGCYESGGARLNCGVLDPNLAAGGGQQACACAP
jgi:hypothetical protein